MFNAGVTHPIELKGYSEVSSCSESESWLFESRLVDASGFAYDDRVAVKSIVLEVV